MALIATILLLVCSTIAVNAESDKCPPLESTSCTCALKWGPLVTCSKISDEQTLGTTLHALHGHSIDLALSNVEISKLAPDTFQNLRVGHLALDRLEVASRDVIHFQGLEESMTILEMDNSFKKNTLPGLKLANLKNLESVMMMDNNIDELSNEWFAGGSKKLFTILLERNGIKTLGDKAFQTLEGLQILWIKGNSFGTISRSVFPSNSKILESIDISNNKITEIPSGLFSDMPELLSVNLADNLLHTIAEDKSILKNTLIHLDGNPLKCDNDLGWICKNEVKLNIHTTKCNSPDSMKEYTLKVFCDIHGRKE